MTLAGPQADDEGDELERLSFKATATVNKVPTIAGPNDGPGHP